MLRSSQLRRAARAAFGTGTAIILVACTTIVVFAQAPLHSPVFSADSARARKTTPATYLVIRIDPHDIPPNGTSSTEPPAAAAAPR